MLLYIRVKLYNIKRGVFMLCDKCKKNKANIQYSQVINGLKVDYNLCKNCYFWTRPQNDKCRILR